MTHRSNALACLTHCLHQQTVEDSERAAVYGHIDSGRSDSVYSFAPAEGNRPVSVFLDTYSEELAFPNIFRVMAV